MSLARLLETSRVFGYACLSLRKVDAAHSASLRMEPRMYRAEEFTYLQNEVTAWRRHLHQNPELDFAVHSTARFVTEK